MDTIRLVMTSIGCSSVLHFANKIHITAKEKDEDVPRHEKGEENMHVREISKEAAQ